MSKLNEDSDFRFALVMLGVCFFVLLGALALVSALRDARVMSACLEHHPVNECKELRK